MKRIAPLLLVTVVLVTAGGGRSPSHAQAPGPPTFVLAWGGTGTDEGQFNGPIGVMARSGHVVVADSGNHRQVCDLTTLMTTSPCLPGIAGSGALQFNNPIDLADDDDDNTVVTDGNNDRIHVFDDQGDPALTFTFGSAGTAEGQSRASMESS